MPSAFSHAFVAIAIGSSSDRIRLFKILLIGSICAAIPDLDAIGFQMGIPYDSLFGHRGITHSFFFSFFLALLVMKLFFTNEIIKGKKWVGLFLYFFLATASHPILDMFTNGGLGVALFAPFSNHRYFFTFRPVKVAPLSVEGFFTTRGWEVFKSELLWIWVPCIVYMLLVTTFRKRK